MWDNYSKLAARIRVPTGLLVGAVYLVFAEPTARSLLVGASVALAGLLLRAISSGYVAKNQRLATGGPYAYTRHPLYLGSAVAGVGFCIAGGRCGIAAGGNSAKWSGRPEPRSRVAIQMLAGGTLCSRRGLIG